MKISLMWFVSLTLALIFLALTQMTKKNSPSSKDSWSQFECGFNIMNPAHLPFSFQFFLISLLFLIFDVEIALLLSYPLEPASIKKLSILLSFILILSIGLVYEWQKGKISWSK